MAYKLKFNLLVLFIAPIIAFGQTNINFGSVNEKSSTFKSINYNSHGFPKGSGDSVHTYFTIMGNDWTTHSVTAPSAVGDTAGATGQVSVTFKPNQNVLHKGLVLVENEYSVVEIVEVEGQGTFSNTYYSTTRNLSEEALKTSLNTLLNNGTVSLGYTTARDNMYATIDNSGGRVECVYTGKMAAFTTRAGANTAGFNCEHTYPQGFFSSVEPEKSDIHHLFPTTTTSNSRRGNDPFGTVSSPTWQDGGSKSGGGVFEPRDAQKGIVARSMMYFVLRHGDFNDNGTPFLSKQETILRSWHSQFGVTQQEKDRNDAIFGLQKNRSPFVDYPQLLERITKISGTSTAAAKYELQMSRSLRDMNVDSAQIFSIDAVIFNSGNQSVTLTSFKTRGEFSIPNVTVSADNDGTVLKPGEHLKLTISLSNYIDGGYVNLKDTLEIKTNAPGFASLEYIYSGAVWTGNSIFEPSLESLSVFPNPSQNIIYFEGLIVNQKNLSIQVYDLAGQLVISQFLNENAISISALQSGSYVAVIKENEKAVYQSRFVKE